MIKNVPRMFQECSKNVPRMFQECSKNVPRMFQECSKNVPRTKGTIVNSVIYEMCKRLWFIKTI